MAKFKISEDKLKKYAVEPGEVSNVRNPGYSTFKISEEDLKKYTVQPIRQASKPQNKNIRKAEGDADEAVYATKGKPKTSGSLSAYEEAVRRSFNDASGNYNPQTGINEGYGTVTPGAKPINALLDVIYNKAVNPIANKAYDVYEKADDYAVNEDDLSRMKAAAEEQAQGQAFNDEGLRLNRALNERKQWLSGMTDEQKRTYLLLPERERKDYLDSIEDELNQKAGIKEAQYVLGKGKETASPAGYAFAAGVQNFKSGLEGAVNLLRGKDGQAVTRGDLEYAYGAVAPTLEGVHKTLSDYAYTTGNMVPSMALGFINPVAGRAAMFASSAGNSYDQSIREGYTPEKSAAYGIPSGLKEVALSYLLGAIPGISSAENIITRNAGNVGNKILGTVIKNEPLRAAASNLIGRIVAEGAEETAQEWLEPALQNMILGQNNNLNFFTDKELRNRMAYAGFLGGLSGGTFNIPGSVNVYNGVKAQRAGVDTSNISNADTTNGLQTEQNTAENSAKVENGAEGRTETAEDNTETARSYLFARNTDERAADTAERAERRGVTEEDIWNTLGLKRDSRGNWIREIDDSGAEFDAKGLTKGRLSDVFKHDEFYREYPEAAKIRFEFADLKGKNAIYNSKKNRITLDNKYKNGNNAEASAKIIHELQHYLQNTEGRSVGGTRDVVYNYLMNRAYEEYSNTREFKRLQSYDQRVEYLENKIKEAYGSNDLERILFNEYRAIEGEEEARAAANRQAMDKYERADNYPEYGDRGIDWTAKEKAEEMNTSGDYAGRLNPDIAKRIKSGILKNKEKGVRAYDEGDVYEGTEEPNSRFDDDRGRPDEARRETDDLSGYRELNNIQTTEETSGGRTETLQNEHTTEVTAQDTGYHDGRYSRETINNNEEQVGNDLFFNEENTETSRQSTEPEVQESAERAAMRRRALETVNRNSPDAQRIYREIMSNYGYGKVIQNMDAVAKKLGTKITYYAEDGRAEGYAEDGSIYLNVKNLRSTQEGVWRLFKHELSHTLQGATKAYGKLFSSKAGQELFNKFLKDNGYTNITELENEIRSRYSKNGKNLTEEELNYELMARFIEGSDILNSEESIRKLTEASPNLAQRIIEWFKYMRTMFKGTEYDKQLAQAERLYLKAVKEAQRNGAYRNTANDINLESDNTESSINNRQYSINKNFESEYDNWDKTNGRIRFNVGSTSEALRSIGVNDRNIVWDSSKILKTKKDHPNITDDVIKQIPQILENPIIIMQSKGFDTRVTMYGEVYDVNNRPVLAVLELRPTNNKGLELDQIKVASTYAKTATYTQNGNMETTARQNAQNLIDGSDILYVDPNKKRTDTWFSQNRLSLPLAITKYGSIKKIHHKSPGVNSNNMQVSEKYDRNKTSLGKAMQKAGITPEMFEDGGGTGRQYSIAEDTETSRYSTEELLKDTGKALEARKQAESDYKAYEKAADKAKLTPKDRVFLDLLYKGTITEEDIPANSISKIESVYPVYKACRDARQAIADSKKAAKVPYKELAERAAEGSDGWKDKKAGIFYSTEIMERNIEDITKRNGGRKNDEAKFINDNYFKPIHHNEAEATRYKNSLTERINGLDLKNKKLYRVAVRDERSGVPTEQLVSERALVQLYGEGLITEQTLTKTGADAEKIKRAKEEMRSIYDELFDKANEALIRNGYEPIAKRADYFPHFTEDRPDTLLGKAAAAVGIDITGDALPTDIAGITNTFRPGKKWVGNFLRREGTKTDYDVLKGFDRYLGPVSDVIYHTDDIQRLRAFETELRYKYSDKGIQDRIEQIRNDETLTPEDRNNRLEALYNASKMSHLPNLVTELRSYTDTLAGKKHKADRMIEDAAGRGVYKFLKSVYSKTGANMVAVNVGSWLTNLIPVTQALGVVKSDSMAKAIFDTIKAQVQSDGFAEKSDFLINRRGSENVSKTKGDIAAGYLTKPFEIIDNLSAEIVTRAIYYDNMRTSLNESTALEYANDMAARLMADRSKGSVPTLFNVQNPLVKTFTMFQLEVNNQYKYYFKDVPADVRTRATGALATAFFKMFLAAFLYNKLYKKIVGRNAATDPIDIALSAAGNYYEAYKGNQSYFKATVSTAKDIAEEVPFIGGVLGGGRVPMSSVMPDAGKLAEAGIGLLTGEMDEKKAMTTITQELMNPALYLLMPIGGGQAKKFIQGVKTVWDGGEYIYDKEGNKKLKYPIDKSDPLKTKAKYVQAAVFGKSALPEAQYYYDKGFKALTVKQTEQYPKVIAAGITYQQYMEALTAARKAESDKDKDGETIPLSLARNKKRAIDKVADEYGLTERQRKILYEANGVSEKVY